MSDPKDKARELYDIDVAEVSLVDRPAIRRTFLITKRDRQESLMNPETAETETEVAKTEVAETETETEVAETETEVAETETEVAETETEVAETETEVDGDVEETEVDGDVEETEKSELAPEEVCRTAIKAAMEADPANASAYEWGMSAFASASAAQVEKADSEADAKLRETAKSITAAQLDELKVAHGKVSDLLTSVGVLKAEEVDSEAKEAEERQANLLEQAVSKALKPIADKLESIDDRVQTVEKSRGVARGAEDEVVVEKKAPESPFAGMFSHLG